MRGLRAGGADAGNNTAWDLARGITLQVQYWLHREQLGHRDLGWVEGH
jgi:hypothetical protein